jgi:chaperonin GroEL
LATWARLAGSKRTVLVGGAGTALAARVAELRARLETAAAGHERDTLRERLGRLAGGIAVLRLGAATEIEMKEKKARADDALRARHAALDEGIVAGGGIALLRARRAVQALAPANADQAAGIGILARALEEPLRRIAAHAGAHPPVVLETVMSSKSDHGFDAATGRHVDLMAAGIVDPAKVVRAAMRNAASVAGLLLTASCTVTAEKDNTMNHNDSERMQ